MWIIHDVSQFCRRARVLVISVFVCIYCAGQVQLHSPVSPFVQFCGVAGGHLCLLRRPYISPLRGNQGTRTREPGTEGTLARERSYRFYILMIYLQAVKTKIRIWICEMEMLFGAASYTGKCSMILFLCLLAPCILQLKHNSLVHFNQIVPWNEYSIWRKAAKIAFSCLCFQKKIPCSVSVCT